MSSGFISETEIQKRREQRQKEWEKVRTEDQPIEAPEEEHDHRSLYDKLQEQKDKKQEEWEESRKFKNQIKNLDEDECTFLDLVDQTRMKEDARIRQEDQRELEEFRRLRASAEESVEEERFRLELQGPQSAVRPAAAASRPSQSQLLRAAVKRKPSTDTAAPAPAPPDQKKPKQSGVTSTDTAAPAPPDQKKPKQSDDTQVGSSEPADVSAVCSGAEQRRACVLPGLATYSDSSSSDDEAGDICPRPQQAPVPAAAAGRRQQTPG